MNLADFTPIIQAILIVVVIFTLTAVVRSMFNERDDK